MFLTQTHQRQRHRDHYEFLVNHGYLVRTCFKQNKRKQENRESMIREYLENVGNVGAHMGKSKTWHRSHGDFCCLTKFQHFNVVDHNFPASS